MASKATGTKLKAAETARRHRKHVKESTADTAARLRAQRIAAYFDPEHDPHVTFREEFQMRLDFNREVVLQELSHFVENATEAELAILDQLLLDRRETLKELEAKALAFKAEAPRRRRGRPHGSTDNRDNGLSIAWWRAVEKQNWKQVCSRLGLTYTKGNIHTAQRWLETWVGKLHTELSQFGECPAGHDAHKWLWLTLADPTKQRWLQRRTGLRFDSDPEGALAVVIAHRPPPQ